MKRKDQNRQRLIEATLDCIAEIGLVETSVSEIIARAGLSRGMIHLHFGGKDNLVIAAAKSASERYYRILEENLAGVENSPRQLIEAAVRSDLGPQALNKRDVSIWYEFRGAARTNRAIAEFSDTRDQRLHELLYHAIREICVKENIPGPDLAARDFTTGLISLTEGMWTDFMLHPDAFDRVKARQVIFKFLAGVWPESFDANGARSDGAEMSAG